MANPYHSFLPTWPTFTPLPASPDPDYLAFAKRQTEVDGEIPACRVGNWREFHELTSHARLADDVFIFRGQRHAQWQLTPSLARGAKNGVYTRDQAADCLESFKRSARGRKELDPSLSNDDEMWALGQHHGLRTPLLDWTFSPYVALFFAFEADDRDPANEARAVFALNMTKLHELAGASPGPDTVRVLQPMGDSNKRLLSQAGLFVAVPPKQTIEGWLLANVEDDVASSPERLAEVIFKIHVPNEDREGCLRMLHRMNIHHASLFPDLVGSSSYSNFDLDIYRPRRAHSSGKAGAP